MWTWTKLAASARSRTSHVLTLLCRRLPLTAKAFSPKLRSARVILALGAIAHLAVLRAFDLPAAAFRFAHAAEHNLGADRVLLDSYHCSRYNTQTRRLTTDMFEAVIRRARDLALTP